MAEPSYKVELVGERTWSLTGPANEMLYLVEGSQAAMLVDTGMGIGDLPGVLRSLTDRPLVVVDTHGHPDHAGGNPHFDSVWMHPADLEILKEMCSDSYRQNDIRAFMGPSDPQAERLIAGLVPYRTLPHKALAEGQRIDLGGRQFEVLECPGHTPGSVCLLNSREQVLFSGDSIVATPVWLYLPHSLSVQAYWQALRRLQARAGEFETIFPGHPPVPLTRQHLAELVTCAESILARPGIGEPTRTFAGQGLLASHGAASILYSPENVASPTGSQHGQ
jgi:glyoxylase-like metal-dependent hydrolase (beta-lactamase superfamily II)